MPSEQTAPKHPTKHQQPMNARNRRNALSLDSSNVTSTLSLFVVSAEGLLGKDAKTLLKKLSALLAEKWEKPRSQVRGCVNALK
jgi:hypothetical protein